MQEKIALAITFKSHRASDLVQLRSRVAEAIEDYGDIDAFNFERPVELLVDGIGTVRVLKVIDIGTIMDVDASITNRLIEE